MFARMSRLTAAVRQTTRRRGCVKERVFLRFCHRSWAQLGGSPPGHCCDCPSEARLWPESTTPPPAGLASGKLPAGASVLLHVASLGVRAGIFYMAVGSKRETSRHNIC